MFVGSCKDVLDKDDKEVIETKTQALAEASSKLAERMYAQNDDAGAEGAQASDANAAADDDVVDAEFEEVDDNK